MVLTASGESCWRHEPRRFVALSVWGAGQWQFELFEFTESIPMGPHPPRFEYSNRLQGIMLRHVLHVGRKHPDWPAFVPLARHFMDAFARSAARRTFGVERP
jgi:hypothetical protein